MQPVTPRTPRRLLPARLRAAGASAVLALTLVALGACEVEKEAGVAEKVVALNKSGPQKEPLGISVNS